jgi:hypothetical protein
MDEPLLMAYQSIDDQAPQGGYYDEELMFDLVCPFCCSVSLHPDVFPLHSAWRRSEDTWSS